MRTKYFKWGNPLFIVFLAIAGLFGVSSAVINSQIKETPVVEEAKATNNTRINVLTTNSYWAEASATTMLGFSNSQWVLCTPDSDIGTKVTIDSITYYLYSGIVDTDSCGSYNNILFQRYSADGSTYWNWEIWGGYVASVSGKWKNTFEITTDNSINEWNVKWWKLTTYTGQTSYSSATDGTKNAYFVANGSDVSNPTDAPEGTSFAGWYSDYTLTTPWNGTVTSDLTLYAKYASNTFTITKDVYYNHTWQSSSTQTVEEGSDYTPTTPSDVAGYVFKGWYWYSESTWQYPVGTIADVNDNYTICAVYEDRSQYVQDSYVYYVCDLLDGEQTPNYIYTFGGHEEFGAWPGTAITSVGTDVHGVVAFQGSASEGYTRRIYKVPYTTAFGDDHLILVYNGGTDAGGDQTADMLLVEGSAYWWSSDADYHNDDAGAALDFIFELESIRNAVTASGDILDYSICGISSSNAATLCTSYNALSESKRSYVDGSYTYTYARLNPSYNDNVSFYDIMDELSRIAGKVKLTGHSAIRDFNLFPYLNEDGNTVATITIIIASSVSLISIAGISIVLIKKRKSKQY